MKCTRLRATHGARSLPCHVHEAWLATCTRVWLAGQAPVSPILTRDRTAIADPSAMNEAESDKREHHR